MAALSRPGASLCLSSLGTVPVSIHSASREVKGGSLGPARGRLQGRLAARQKAGRLLEPDGWRKSGSLLERDAPKFTQRSLNLRAQAEDGGVIDAAQREKVVPGILDHVFLTLFRRAMAREVGWDSQKVGYDGLVEVANRLMAKHTSRFETEEATVRILRSMFPPALLPLFRMLVAPLSGGQPAAILTARVTQATCQWLMGPCKVNDIELPDGSKMSSGVLVEKCKYLEESKCAGICIHTCKMPTQAFIKNDMGIPLVMEPNFEDYSCQFKFGVEPPPREQDEALQSSCLSICPAAAIASKRSETSSASRSTLESSPRSCPQVVV